MGTYWIEFDNLYMKQNLIHGWPYVKEQHDEMSKIIKKEINEYKIIKKNKKKHIEHEHELGFITLETPEKLSNEFSSSESPKLILFPTGSNKFNFKLNSP
jgi:hypothetical protein